MPTKSSESAAHLCLKRLAMHWAQANGYPVVATEVSVPQFRLRLDVAAYCPAKQLEERPANGATGSRRVSVAAIGATAIFECKVSRPDYLRNARSIAATEDRLKRLSERKARHEETLRLHCPSIRNGDSLFQEYETLNFERPGYEAYQRVLDEMRLLSARLHGKTKFDRLVKWRAANLHYVVADPGLFREHELPVGWGVLLRKGESLELERRPFLQDVNEAGRLALLHRIAMAGTRAVNAAHGVLPWRYGDAEVAPLGTEKEKPDAAGE